jgi:TATA-box binding protein (TBP) (component of TFIID and TFIIIB)
LRTINVGANNAEANNADASPLRISTMTVQVKYTPATDIPLVPFQTAFFDSVVQDEWIPEFFGSGTLKLQKKQDSFYNCILFTHTDAVADAGNDDADADAGAGAKPKKTAIKLFCNGTLHITGLSDIRAVVDFAKRFTAFISRLTDVQLTVADFSIQLINGNFKISRRLLLKPMYEKLLATTQHLCRYNPEKHAGIIVQMMMADAHKVSVIVFDTGSILISAFVTGQQLAEAHAFIVGFIRDHAAAFERNAGYSDGEGDEPKAKKRCCRCRNGTAATATDFDYGKFLVLK